MLLGARVRSNREFRLRCLSFRITPDSFNAAIDTVNSTAVFTVTLNPPPDAQVSVNFTTVDGTAVAGIDYVATSQTVTFATGEGERTVTVPLITPSPAEAKNFFGQLSSPRGGPIWISRGSAKLVPAE